MKKKTLPKWKRRLDARQRRHIKETTQRGTLAELRRNIDTQRRDDFPCWECEGIANRLNLPEAKNPNR